MTRPNLKDVKLKFAYAHALYSSAFLIEHNLNRNYYSESKYRTCGDMYEGNVDLQLKGGKESDSGVL